VIGLVEVCGDHVVIDLRHPDGWAGVADHGQAWSAGGARAEFAPIARSPAELIRLIADHGFPADYQAATERELTAEPDPGS
jgi:hypothetical protein